MSEWGTTFPAEMDSVTRAARTMEVHGYDVHTVTVMLNNGSWQVTLLATDEDMQDVEAQFEMDSHGCAHPFDIKSIEPMRRTR